MRPAHPGLPSLVPHSVVSVGILVTSVLLAALASGRPLVLPGLAAETITGTERLAWNQQAADAAELAAFRYTLHVDDVPSELTDVSCAKAAEEGGFACSAALPPLSPGSHTLTVATFVVEDGVVLESARSAPLHVALAAAPSATRELQDGMSAITVDGVRLRVDVVSAGLSAPHDLAFAPDGRIFIAERDGIVRIVRHGQRQPDATRVPDEIVTSAGGGGLLAIALDPEFLRTGHVYLTYTVRGRRGTVFRLARFREVNGTLGEPAVLLDDIRVSIPASASLRFGPDGKLYAAFDDAGDERLRGDLGSLNGKILRLNPDGTTPADQPSGSPVFLDNIHSPRGLDWHPEAKTLWMVHTASDTSARLTPVWFRAGAPTRARAGASHQLPHRVAAMAFYRGALIPAFRNDLLLAAGEGRHILRLGIDAATGNVLAAERLLEDRAGAVRVVAVSARGEIYFCTETTLGRLIPA